MIIYLYVFLLSYFCSLIAQKTKNIISVEFIFFSFLAIIIPSLLAGFRDITVGIDIKVYALYIFNEVKSLNSLNSLTYYNENFLIEPLYLFYNYFITRFTDVFFWFLFIQQFLVLSLVYSFAIAYRTKISISLFWLIYLLLFFNESLNIVRQSFSVALIIYSFRFLFDRRIYYHYACILLAYTFHYSAILSSFLYPLYWFLYGIKYRRSIIWLLSISIIIIGWNIYTNFNEILIYAVSNELISYKYVGYIGESSTVHKTDLILCVVIWLIALITKTKYRLHGNNSFTIYTMIAIIILLHGVYTDVVHRIAIYVILMEIIMLLMHLHRLKLKVNKIFYTYLLILFLFVRLINFALSDNALSGTVPYTSKHLKIVKTSY